MSRARAVLLGLGAAGLLAAAPAAAAGAAPVVTGVAAACGPAAGGTTVVVQGTGLAADDTVTFGGIPATSQTYYPAVTAPGQLRRPAALAAVTPAGSGTVPVAVTSSGGETSAPTPASRYTYTSALAPAFGLCDAATSFTDPATGAPLTQAGGHPDVTVSLSFTGRPDATGADGPAANARDIDVTLPEGVVGDPAAIPAAQRCTQRQLSLNACPVASQVGSVTVLTGAGPLSSVQSPQNASLPVYSVVPPPGYPAELALLPLSSLNLDVAVPILVTLRKDASGGYRLVASIRNLLQAKPVVGLSMTLFGTPRGASRPFMTFAPDCAAPPLTTTVSVASWVDPGARATAQATSPAPSTGCTAAPFAPSIDVAPTTTQADAPAGYAVGLRFDQAAGPDGQAPAPLRDVAVTLPPGVSINPSVADGAAVCTPAAFGLDDDGPSHCPEASAIGTVSVETPLLDAPLTGAVRLAQAVTTPTVPANPFTIFVEAAGSGIDVKLQGTLTADAQDGRLTARFTGLPPVPISALRLRFAGGPRAALANPAGCGTAATSAVLSPWSARGAATATSAFTVDADGRGGGCPASWPSAPGFSAGPTNPAAGAATGFTVTVTREDRQAPLTALAITTPPGFSGLLAGVPRCADAEAARGACPAASRVGAVTVGAGAGSNPYTLTGDVFLAGAAGGAPFSLVIVVAPVAGPFELGTPLGAPVVIRAPIAVQPKTAQLTIRAPLPQIQDGVPLRLRLVNVTIDRPGFAINPTDCSALAVTGTVGATPVSSPFQVAGCDRLAFAPQLAATTSGRPTKARGAALDVVVTVPRGGANLRSTTVTLPRLLGPRLATLARACPRATFDANPAGCAAAEVGTVRAQTPVLPDPLTGKVYIVAAKGLPTLEAVLQGDGVTIPLTGQVATTSAGLRTTFDAIPDVPITTFTLSLPQGAHPLLETSAKDLCGQTLAMPVAFTGQNGTRLSRTVTVAPTGCAPVHVLGATVGRRSLVLRLALARRGTVRVSSPYVRTRRATLAAGEHRLTVRLSARGVARVRRKGRAATTLTITFAGRRSTTKVRF